MPVRVSVSVVELYAIVTVLDPSAMVPPLTPLTAITSPSLANVPPTIFTVALARLRLSTSETVRALDRVCAAAFSVYDALVATLVSTGGSLIAVMLMVSVCAVLRLNEPEPSLSTQVTVRVLLEP